jgi:hypothetical protein
MVSGPFALPNTESKENLENQPIPRENGPLIAVQAWIDRRQAVGIW